MLKTEVRQGFEQVGVEFLSLYPGLWVGFINQRLW